MATSTAEYEALADRAELASEELDIRAGRSESDNRPLQDASEDDLIAWSTWDPEQDPDVIEDLGGGIQLRRAKPRSTARRRLKAEPEGPMPEPEPEAAAAPKAQAPSRVHRAQPPKRISARIPLGGGLSQIVGAIGVGLAMSGRDPLVGMALQFEAPLAGEKIDQAIQGTPLDRIAQPLARAGKAASSVGSVLALPLLVGLIERRPELYLVLKEPLLRPLVTEMAIELEEAGQRAKARLEAAERRGSGRLVDSDALLAMLFEGRPPQPPDAAAAG